MPELTVLHHFVILLGILPYDIQDTMGQELTVPQDFTKSG